VTGVKRIINIDTTTKVVTVDVVANATVAGAVVANSDTAVFEKFADLVP
jgi:hypothetical protein